MMKRLAILTLFGVLCATAVNAQNTKEALQNIYSEMLEEEGISSYVDSDGDLSFDYNDRNYYIIISESDQEFFRLVLPNIWPIESENERIEVIRAADTVSRSMKVAKAYTLNDDVWITVELFLPSPYAAQDVFTRSINAIEDGVERFVEEMY